MNHRVNEVILVGNMAMDAKWSPATDRSQSRAFFKFAVSSDQPGGKPVYLDIIAWDKNADAVAQHGGKGRELYFHGHLTNWNNNTQIVIDRVEFWAEAKKQTQSAPQPQPLSSREQPRQAAPRQAPPPVAAEPSYADYDDPDLYTVPGEPEPEPEVQKEVEEVTLDERKELAKTLAGLGLDTADVKDMLVKLTTAKLERDERDRF